MKTVRKLYKPQIPEYCERRRGRSDHFIMEGPPGRKMNRAGLDLRRRHRSGPRTSTWRRVGKKLGLVTVGINQPHRNRIQPDPEERAVGYAGAPGAGADSKYRVGDREVVQCVQHALDVRGSRVDYRSADQVGDE